MKKLPEPSSVYNRLGYRGYNICMVDYETTKKKYESVKPLIGQRVKHGMTDHRPLTDRYRTFEIWRKEGDKYGMAFCSVYANHSRDQATGKVTVTGYAEDYYPVLMVCPDGRYEFTPKWMHTYTTWDLLGALFPRGLSYAKFGSKQYVCADQPDGTKNYYYQDGQRMTFVPYECDGKTFYEVIGGLPETKLLIDREKVKKVYQELEPFLNYYEIMSPFVTPENENRDWRFKHSMDEMLDKGDWLVRNEGEEFGEQWMHAVEAMFVIHTRWKHTWGGSNHVSEPTYPDRKYLESKLRGEYLYRITRPYKQVAMDVGVPFYSNGRKIK